MKPNRSKCIWTAVIAAVAVCMTLSTAYAAGNLGHGYISNVTSSSGNCVANTPTGEGQKWDIQAGGTYTVTLSGIDDLCSQGNLSTIEVIVHNTTGGNVTKTATQQDVGVYTFTITLTTQCLTMPIEYCSTNGKFAQDYDSVSNGPGGKVGHLRTATFDDGCNATGEDTTCQGGCAGASITVCKYFDFNANGSKDQNNQYAPYEVGLANWPFCLTPLTAGASSQAQQTTANGGCVTFSDLAPGTYLVSEASADGWTNSTDMETITIDHCGQPVTVNFGNYCTQASGGLTLGFWSNKNGNKLITSDGASSGTGRNLKTDVVSLLNGCSLRNANGTVHAFFANNGYADFRNWLLSANATNMANMLSAQMAALKLDVYFNKVDGNAYDLCSFGTVNQLILAACADLAANGTTLSGNPNRLPQEMWKNCMDAINNNGPVVPVTPCDRANTSYSSPCGQ